MKKQWVPKSRRIARDIAFLSAFYDSSNFNTFQKGKESAIHAGFKEKTASRVAENLLEKYRGFDFKAISEAMGIDRINIGLALRKILQRGAPRDILSAARLLLSNMGEITDSAASRSVNVSTGPVMVIVGATDERMQALCRGGSPQFETRETPALAEAVIDVQSVESEPTLSQVNPKPQPNIQRLSASDFSGPNRGDTSSYRRVRRF